MVVIYKRNFCTLFCLTTKNITRYNVRTIPAAGALLRPEDTGEEQMELFDNEQ